MQLQAHSHTHTHTHTHTHPFNGLLSGTTRVSRYQKGKTSLDFTETRDSERHWHQLGHMQVCTLLQTDNHASTPPLSFLQAGFPSCRPTNSVKALKAAEYNLAVGESDARSVCVSYVFRWKVVKQLIRFHGASRGSVCVRQLIHVKHRSC